MSEYDKVLSGKLLLKGEKRESKKRKHKKKHKETVLENDTDLKDATEHGEWKKVKKIETIAGPVAIELGLHTYIKALDNGLFTVGVPHKNNEGPYPEEIFTAVVINEQKVAFKSGYGKYLRAEKNGTVTGRSDAIGAMEQWEPVFQEGKMALQSFAECFLGVNEEDTVIAINKKAGTGEEVTIRSQIVEVLNPHKDVPVEEQGELGQVELNYVKKFQKFQDKKIRLCTDTKDALKKAKEDGIFHETLLDRRSKMKSDRYCK